MLVVLVRSAILYITVVVFMRMMGKRQISQMQPFELVITIMVADLVAGPMENMGIPLIEGVIPLITLLVIHNLFDVLCQKSKVMRRIICGSPSILIENGVLNQKELRKLNINMSDLMENLRNTGNMDISQIMYCIIETNGTISVIPKAANRPATSQEAGVKAQETTMTYTVIYEGKADKQNLAVLNLSEATRERNLKRRGFQGISDVYVAMLDLEDKLFVQQNKTMKACTANLKRTGTL